MQLPTISCALLAGYLAHYQWSALAKEIPAFVFAEGSGGVVGTSVDLEKTEAKREENASVERTCIQKSNAKSRRGNNTKCHISRT